MWWRFHPKAPSPTKASGEFVVSTIETGVRRVDLGQLALLHAEVIRQGCRSFLLGEGEMPMESCHE